MGLDLTRGALGPTVLLCGLCHRCHTNRSRPYAGQAGLEGRVLGCGTENGLI